MSEAELHILRQRLLAGRLSKGKSGSYRQCLPTGYVWLGGDTVEQDPDEQVRHVLALIFAKFDEIGSCHGVFRFLRLENILLPRRRAGTGQGAIHWKMASITAVSDILTNPAYAGAFVYGRQRADPRRQKPGCSAVPRVNTPMEDWFYLRKDAYPAYITWEQYLRNQERIHANGLRYMALREQAAGAVREGHGLLQGLAVCGHCGRRMYTNYKPRPTYSCAQQRHQEHCLCCIVQGTAVDDAVTDAFFQAIRPAALDALQQVLAAQDADQSRLEQLWKDQLRRAQYETRLAERQYRAVDPDNRLVASTLEQRWEEKLAQLQRIQDDYDRFMRNTQGAQLSPQLCEQFRRISETLPGLWARDQVSSAQKKALLRAIIANVILKREAADRVEIKIVWVSGHYSITHAQLPVRRETELVSYNAMVSRVGELHHQGLDDPHIAETLSHEGFHSARKSAVSASKVYKIRLENRWLCLAEIHHHAIKVDGCWTTRGLANELGTETRWVLKRIYRETIPPARVHRHPISGVYLIDNDPELLDALRRATKT